MSIAVEEDVVDVEASKNDDRYLVPGLVRGLAILQAFNQEAQEMTISEIAEILDVNRSSAFRLIYLRILWIFAQSIAENLCARFQSHGARF